VNLAFPGVYFSLAFLGILYDTELGITAITPWTILLVALLLSIGTCMVYTPKKKKKVKNHEVDGSDFVVFDEEDGNQFDFSSSFVGSIKYVNSDNFEAANIDAKFAGMKVYFDNAVIQNGHATVNLNVSFAGVELYIPKNWRIDNQMSASFGGVEEKNRSNGADGPILTLRGNVSLGGVTILYV
jgi:predicted membrane protein